MKNTVFASEEQTAYANLLFYGCWLGLLTMLITYSLYVFGILEPHVAFKDLPQLWTKPVGEYLKIANVPTGWGWTNLLNRGDFINFIGIVLLAGLSVVCYLRIIPSLIRKQDKVMYLIAISEVIVLLAVASGLISGGDH